MRLGLGLGLENKERSKEDPLFDGKLGHHSILIMVTNACLYHATTCDYTCVYNVENTEQYIDGSVIGWISLALIHQFQKHKNIAGLEHVELLHL